MLSEDSVWNSGATWIEKKKVLLKKKNIHIELQHTFWRIREFKSIHQWRKWKRKTHIQNQYPPLRSWRNMYLRMILFTVSHIWLFVSPDHISPLCRTLATRPTSVCGISCTQSSLVCLWRARRRASPVSSTPTMPTCWRAPWTSTTARGTATWRRLEDCWTPRATASACRWVSGAETDGEELKVIERKGGR